MLNSSKLQILNSPQFVLVKNNVVYMLAIVLFIFIGFSFLPKQLLAYNELRQKNNALKAEISKQESRLKLIQSIDIKDINQLLLILNTLYPQVEDQFSIYPVIDNLQFVTGMIFVKKSSPFVGDVKTPVVISVEAIGTLDQITTLLRDYPYKSARILTLQSFTMNQNKSNPQLWNVGFAVGFHAKEISAGKQAIDKIDPMAIDFARQAAQYFTSKGAKYTNISIKDEDIPINYSVKKNPFNN